MKKNLKSKKAYSFMFIPIIIAAGIICMLLGVYNIYCEKQNNEQAIEKYQIENVNHLIDIVDIALNDELNDVKNIAENRMVRSNIFEIEATAVETNNYDVINGRIQNIFFDSTDIVKYYLAYFSDNYLFGNVPEKLMPSMSVIYDQYDESLSYWEIGEDWYLAYSFVSENGITYYAVIDVEEIFNNLISEKMMKENWIVFYDEHCNIFFQNHDNQPQTLILDDDELKERADGYTIIANQVEKNQSGYDYYEYENYYGEKVINCICTKPYSLTKNGYLSIGVAQKISSVSDIVDNTYSSVLFFAMCAFGLFFILIGIFLIVNKRKKSEEQVKKLQMEKELIAVKNKLSLQQMQPHFLYNALASIREIVLDDPQYASDLIYDFTTHLRACIRSLSNDELVPFSKELENINAYVNIEKMRFGDNLSIEYDIQCKDFSVVPLSVQPLVENAIRHGVFKRGSKGGYVRLITREEESYYKICVCDNGNGFDYEKIKKEVESGERDSTGLLNLIFRLKNKLGATVDVNSEIGKGTEIIIKIPKENKGML